MSVKLVILTEIIAPYRIPVFNVLAKWKGIDLHVIFLAETDPDLREWLVYKDEIKFSYEVLRSRRGRVGKYKILLNSGVTGAIKKASPQTILCGGYNYLASWQALYWARKNKVPFLLWVESNAKDKDKDQRGNNPLTSLLKAYFVNRCDAFVVPGKASRQYVMNFKVSAEKIHNAPNAVENELFESIAMKTRINEDDFRAQLNLPRQYFLFVGRLVPGKGIFDLVSAYSKLPPDLRNKLSVVIVGEGSSRRELENRARSISNGSVHFAGFVHRERLASYYALAEAFVFPTHADPWGLVVNEAMACGLPVICTDVAGCSDDLISDGWNGVLVPARDTEKLMLGMKALAENPERLRIMGENSRERIKQYSPFACARGIADAAFLSVGATQMI